MTTTYITKKLNVKGIGYTVLEASGKNNYISVSKDMPNSRRGTLGKEFASYNEAYSYYKCPFLKAELLKAELNLILPSQGVDVTETESVSIEMTLTQVKELHILVVGLKDELLSGVEGTARVAKAIQLYLDCDFGRAVEILGILIDEL